MKQEGLCVCVERSLLAWALFFAPCAGKTCYTKEHALLILGSVHPDGSKGTGTRDNDCELNEITYAYVSKEEKDRIK